jgi:hypothetical protein
MGAWKPWGVAMLAAAALACSPSTEQRRVQEEEIRQAIAGYLPRLAEAYDTGDAEVLRDLAVAREVARVANSIEDLASQGLAFHPRLKQLTIETFKVWRHVNATATTVEVWDVDKRVVGTDRVLSQAQDLSQRVHYQLRLRDGVWQVFYRDAEPPAG